MRFHVQDLVVEYDSVRGAYRAIDGISLTVEGGEVHGIVGESGSGKTTAILAMLGLVRPGGRIVSGRVELDGVELLSLSHKDWRGIRGKRIGLITQNPRASLNPVMRVGQQIVAAHRAHNDVTKEQAEVRGIELLEMVGINDPEQRMQAFPHELSGGMAQRVLAALALSCSPELLIADEPTSGMDVTIQARMLDDLRRATQEVGSSLLLVTQDLGIVANYCDQVHLLHAGEVVESSDAVSLFDEPSHPASVALLAAQRRSADTSLRLEGLPVDLRNPPSGCLLRRRCPFADVSAGCLDHPALETVAPGHQSRCHRAAEVRVAAMAHFAATGAPATLVGSNEGTEGVR